MSDAPTAEAQKEAAEKPAKSGSSKLPLVLAILNIGATGFVVSRVIKPMPVAEAAGAAEAAPSSVAPTGPVVAMEPFVVNLNEPGSSRYLKASFEFEMANGKAVDELDKLKRVVRDDILRYLSGLSVADTLGEQNKAKIQDTIVSRIDHDLGGGRVHRIFFIEFVVQ